MDNVLFSSDKMDWGTPGAFIHGVQKEFGDFTLDAAASGFNSVAPAYIGPPEEPHACPEEVRGDCIGNCIPGRVGIDALAIDWAQVPSERVWLNPPYGRRVGTWIKKAREQSMGVAESITCLVAARTDTTWWHEHVEKAYAVYLVRGRLRFWQQLTLSVEGGVFRKETMAPAPFPSALVVFNGAPPTVRGTMDQVGHVLTRLEVR